MTDLSGRPASGDTPYGTFRHLRHPSDGDRGVATDNRAYGFGLHPGIGSDATLLAMAGRHAVDRVRRG